MIEMTLSSRHRIRNSSPGGLRPSTLPLATSRSRRLPTILTFTRGWGRHIFVSLTAETGNRTPNSGVKSSGASHYPRAPAPDISSNLKSTTPLFVLPQYRHNSDLSPLGERGASCHGGMLSQCFLLRSQ